MDVDEIIGVSRKLGGQSEDLSKLTTEIDGLVRRALEVWEGDDALQFLDWWERDHKPRLLAAQETLRRLSDAANQSAQDQARISS